MKKSVIALALSATMLGGGAVGAAALTPTLTAVQQPVDTAPSDSEAGQDRKAKAADRLAEVLAPLVEDGTLTQSQVDAVVETVTDARQDARQDRKQKRQDRRGDRLEALAEATGIATDVWADGFKSGATLAETAEANSLSTDELVDILVAQQQARLDEAVASGKIDADKAEKRSESLEERVTDRVNGERPEGRRGRGPGHHARTDQPGN